MSISLLILLAAVCAVGADSVANDTREDAEPTLFNRVDNNNLQMSEAQFQKWTEKMKLGRTRALKYREFAEEGKRSLNPASNRIIDDLLRADAEARKQLKNKHQGSGLHPNSVGHKQMQQEDFGKHNSRAVRELATAVDDSVTEVNDKATTIMSVLAANGIDPTPGFGESRYAFTMGSTTYGIDMASLILSLVLSTGQSKVLPGAGSAVPTLSVTDLSSAFSPVAAEEVITYDVEWIPVDAGEVVDIDEADFIQVNWRLAAFAATDSDRVFSEPKTSAGVAVSAKKGVLTFGDADSTADGWVLCRKRGKIIKPIQVADVASAGAILYAHSTFGTAGLAGGLAFKNLIAQFATGGTAAAPVISS